MIPFAEKYGFPWQDFDPTFLNLGIVDGELHMLPKQGDVIIPYINLRMAKEAGVTPPLDFDPAKDPDGWTWAEFETMYKRLTVDQNGKRGDEPGFDKENVAVYGAAMNVDQWYIYVPMVLAEGGQFVSDDNSTSMLNSAGRHLGVPQADPADDRRLLGAADADPDDEQRRLATSSPPARPRWR